MFKCNNCGGQQAPGVKPQKAVIERRDKVYTDKKDAKKIIGKGWEIVRELALCGECRELFV
jgi:hypothetical protein